MTDLEQLLRQDLDRSAEAHPVALSSADVLAAGQAHVRRRTTRRAAAGLCLVLALGGGGYGLSRVPDRAPLVAAPLPDDRPDRAETILDPPDGRDLRLRVVLDTRAVAPQHGGAGLGGSLTFTPVGAGPGGSGAVRLPLPARGSATFGVGGRPAQGAAPTTRTDSRTTPSLDDLVVGAVPAPDATGIELAWGPGAGPMTTVSTSRIGGSGYTAFVVACQGLRGEGLRRGLRAVLWTSGDGTVHASDATRELPVPSVPLPTEDGPTTIYG